MQNLWLEIEDDEENFEAERDGVFFGVFNRPPEEIAKQLPRLHAPLPSRRDQDSQRLEKCIDQSEWSLESPATLLKASPRHVSNPLISVFC